jgi:hypothetical protein
VAAVTILDYIGVAFRLAKRDVSAFVEVENSPAAFWFSFRAALVTLPFLVATIMLSAEGAVGPLDLLAEIAQYAVGWLLFPVVMLEVCVAIDRQKLYCRYIATSNWCGVIEDSLLALILVLRAVDIIPGSLGGILFVGVVVWVFSFQFYVARHGLRLDPAGAALIVGLRLILALALFFAKAILGG